MLLRGVLPGECKFIASGKDAVFFVRLPDSAKGDQAVAVGRFNSGDIAQILATSRVQSLDASLRRHLDDAMTLSKTAFRMK